MKRLTLAVWLNVRFYILVEEDVNRSFIKQLLGSIAVMNNIGVVFLYSPEN